MQSNESRPRVSVVMTAYKHSEFIPEAIDSILSRDPIPGRDGEPGGQDGDVEIILVDDGSPEDIESVIAPYRERIRYIKRKNGGLGAARNTGWEEARGEYVAFCDSDDIHLPHRLPCHVALLDQCPDAAVVCSDLMMYENGEITAETTLRDRPGIGPIPGTFDEALEEAYGTWRTAAARDVPVPDPYKDRRVYQGRVPHLVATLHYAWGGASMYRRDALADVGGHSSRLRRWPDWHLASKLCKSYEIVYLDVPVLWYRQHGGQLTKQARVGAHAYRDIVYELWKDDPQLAAEHPEIRARIVGRAAMRLAYYEAQDGNYRVARRLILDSLKLNPTDIHGYSALLRNALKELRARLRR